MPFQQWTGDRLNEWYWLYQKKKKENRCCEKSIHDVHRSESFVSSTDFVNRNKASIPQDSILNNSSNTKPVGKIELGNSACTFYKKAKWNGLWYKVLEVLDDFFLWKRAGCIHILFNDIYCRWPPEKNEWMLFALVSFLISRWTHRLAPLDVVAWQPKASKGNVLVSASSVASLTKHIVNINMHLLCKWRLCAEWKRFFLPCSQ